MVEYYDAGRVISKQRKLNMIIGPRGYGKTYGYKRYCISKAIKGKGKFIYLRRKKTEVDEVVDLMDDLRDDPLFQNYVFRQQKNEVYYAEEKDGKDRWIWKHIGTIIALSLQANFKSRSFSAYRTIIFDEWLPLESNGFLRNEVKKFESLVDTTIRDRPDFQIFLIGNSSVLFNPYFEKFDIYPSLTKEFTYHKNKMKSMLVQVIDSSAWSNYRKQTEVGKLFAGTEYLKYASDNEFEDNDNSLVEPKPASCRNIMVFTLDAYTVGVWHDCESGKLWFSDNFNNTCPEKYAFDYDDLDEEYQSAKNLYESHNMQFLQQCRQKGLIRFDSAKAKAHSRVITNRIRLL